MKKLIIDPHSPKTDPTAINFPYTIGFDAAPNTLANLAIKIVAVHPAAVRKKRYADTMLPWASGLTVLYIIAMVGAMNPSLIINLKARKAKLT